jgi:hypothetical protein
MHSNTVANGLLSGAVAAIVAAVLHLMFLQPVLLRAEEYETGARVHSFAAAPRMMAAGDHAATKPALRGMQRFPAGGQPPICRATADGTVLPFDLRGFRSVVAGVAVAGARGYAAADMLHCGRCRLCRAFTCALVRSCSRTAGTAAENWFCVSFGGSRRRDMAATLQPSPSAGRAFFGQSGMCEFARRCCGPASDGSISSVPPELAGFLRPVHWDCRRCMAYILHKVCCGHRSATTSSSDMNDCCDVASRGNQPGEKNASVLSLT